MRKLIIICLFFFPFFGGTDPHYVFEEKTTVERVEVKLDNLNREIWELNKLIECEFIK